MDGRSTAAATGAEQVDKGPQHAEAGEDKRGDEHHVTDSLDLPFQALDRLCRLLGVLDRGIGSIAFGLPFVTLLIMGMAFGGAMRSVYTLFAVSYRP